jgi:hypothetical protein
MRLEDSIPQHSSVSSLHATTQTLRTKNTLQNSSAGRPETEEMPIGDHQGGLHQLEQKRQAVRSRRAQMAAASGGTLQFVHNSAVGLYMQGGFQLCLTIAIFPGTVEQNSSLCSGIWQEDQARYVARSRHSGQRWPSS